MQASSGQVTRFGSSYQLAEEMKKLRVMIAAADPSSVEWSSDIEVPDQLLWAAWQVSDTVVRLCAEATLVHLPLWTTG